MKTLASLILIVASSAQAALTYQCQEKASDAFKYGRLQYALVLRLDGRRAETQKAHLSLLSRDPRDGASPFKPMLPTFEAVAETQGTLLRIDAMAKHRLKFIADVNHMEQALMELQWVRGDIDLKCKL